MITGTESVQPAPFWSSKRSWGEYGFPPETNKRPAAQYSMKSLAPERAGNGEVWAETCWTESKRIVQTTIQHLDREAGRNFAESGTLNLKLQNSANLTCYSALLHTVTASNQVIDNRDRNQDGRPDNAECR